MAIMDTTLEFADATSVAGSAGTALIGDVIDLSAVPADPGQFPGPLYCVISCATSIITGGSAGTIQFKLASDAQAAIATDGSATEHYAGPAHVTDGDDANDLDAGALIAMFPLPMNSVNANYERYLGILAVIATTTVTAGAIDAYLTRVPPAWKSFPDGNN